MQINLVIAYAEALPSELITTIGNGYAKRIQSWSRPYLISMNDSVDRSSEKQRGPTIASVYKVEPANH
jgi:hypothetical protein